MKAKGIEYDCGKNGPPFGLGWSPQLCGACLQPIRKLPNGCSVHVALTIGDKKNIADLRDVANRYPNSWLAKVMKGEV